jgi:hypothetical protein
MKVSHQPVNNETTKHTIQVRTQQTNKQTNKRRRRRRAVDQIEAWIRNNRWWSVEDLKR